MCDPSTCNVECVVTKHYGIDDMYTNFTQVCVITVHAMRNEEASFGGCMFMLSVCILLGPPLAPRNFKLKDIVDDLRHGYSGSAVISLEWEPPEGKSQNLLSHVKFIHIGRCPI